MCGGLLAQYIIADLTATMEEGEKNHHLKMKNMRVEETCPRPCSIWWWRQTETHVYPHSLPRSTGSQGVGLHEGQFHQQSY